MNRPDSACSGAPSRSTVASILFVILLDAKLIHARPVRTKTSSRVMRPDALAIRATLPLGHADRPPQLRQNCFSPT